MSEPKIKAIETLYGGHLFRSLTEARWAAFFDIMGWRWTYEPQEFNGYIPDFLLHLRAGPLWVEVKGAESTFEGLERHTEKIEKSGLTGDILLVGNTPVLDSRERFLYGHNFAIGLVGQYVSEEREKRHAFSEALVTGCCDAGFGSYLHYWRCYNCGEGGKHIWGSSDAPLLPAVELFQRAWGEAHQKVRYTPRKRSEAARDEARLLLSQREQS